MNKLEKILSDCRNEIKTIIRKEYPDGQEYSFGDVCLSKEDIVKAFDMKDEYEGFDNAVAAIYDIRMLEEQREEFLENIKDLVLDFLNGRIPDFSERKLRESELDTLYKFAAENLEYNDSIEELKTNTSRIEEITINLELPGRKCEMMKYEPGASMNPENFSPEGLEESMEELMSPGNVDPIDWLIQTQGYELADLYDPGKVKNSRFLESLRSEICDSQYKDFSWLCLSFTAIGGDFKSLEAVLLGNKDIIVRPENQGYIGISWQGDGSKLGVELEREVVIPRKWIETSSLYFAVNSKEITEYGIQNKYKLADSRHADVFRETSKEPIRMKPIDFRKLKENALRTVEKQKKQNMTRRKGKDEYGTRF